MMDAVVEAAAVAVADELRKVIMATTASNESVAESLEAAMVVGAGSVSEATARDLRAWRENSRSRLRKGLPPRRFNSQSIPPALYASVWARLEGAVDRPAIDAAFDSATKAKTDSRTDRIVDHYTPEVRDAMAQIVAADTIRHAIRAAYQAGGGLTKSRDDRHKLIAAAARAVLHAAEKALDGIRKVLAAIYGDGYLNASHNAAQQAGTTIEGALEQVIQGLPSGYWDTWEPEFGVAVTEGADGALADLIAESDAVIGGIVDTRLDRIAAAIADGVAQGLGVDAVADMIEPVVQDERHAWLIADTELARASTLASLSAYRAANIAEFDLLTARDPCPKCAAIAANNPHPMSDTSVIPPAGTHPGCRCALAPHLA